MRNQPNTLLKTSSFVLPVTTGYSESVLIWLQQCGWLDRNVIPLMSSRPPLITRTLTGVGVQPRSSRYCSPHFSSLKVTLDTYTIYVSAKLCRGNIFLKPSGVALPYGVGECQSGVEQPSSQIHISVPIAVGRDHSESEQDR